MELFERAAYYGMNSVLAIYLTSSVASGGLGVSVEADGFLRGIIYAATYVLPILGGALADRYGYRRMLTVAFSFLACGYFVAGYMSNYALVFLALSVMATGAGLFKPIISGTIARTTDETNSAFGFGIYYWMINLGAFISPLVVSVLKGWSWRYVFAASALYTGLMLLPTIFVYRDPPGTGSGKTLKDTLMGAAEVLGDSRFMLMIVVYSGFWILYFQNFGTVLYYLRDFVDRAPVSLALTSAFQAMGLPWTFTFDAEHVTVINAGTIILLQVFVSRIVKNRPALGTMVTGMAIGALGFLCLAASTQRVGVRARDRGVLDRRDDRAPEVLQLRRAGGAGRPQGRLHGVRVPVRRLRLAARREPRVVPLREVHDTGDRHAGGRRARAAVLAGLRGPRRGRRAAADCLRQAVRAGHAGDTPVGPDRHVLRLYGGRPARNLLLVRRLLGRRRRSTGPPSKR